MNSHLRLLNDQDPIEGERFDVLPAESPRELIANAVQILIGHEQQHAALWTYSPELRNVEALLLKAIYALDRTAP